MTVWKRSGWVNGNIFERLSFIDFPSSRLRWHKVRHFLATWKLVFIIGKEAKQLMPNNCLFQPHFPSIVLTGHSKYSEWISFSLTSTSTMNWQTSFRLWYSLNMSVQTLKIKRTGSLAINKILKIIIIIIIPSFIPKFLRGRRLCTSPSSYLSRYCSWCDW